MSVACLTSEQLAQLSRARELLRTGAAQAIRVGAHLTKAEVARAVGVDDATILRWERGDRRPRGEPGLRYGRLLEELMAGRS